MGKEPVAERLTAPKGVSLFQPPESMDVTSPGKKVRYDLEKDLEMGRLSWVSQEVLMESERS